MQAMKEITGTVGEFRYPEHIYFVEKSKCYGYIKEGESELTIFSKPMKFDVRRRQFVKKKVNFDDYK